jgi:serine/threonine protein kinase
LPPEVFSRNFGNVSAKADVYSFGILLLEIVGGKKNVDITIKNTSTTKNSDFSNLALVTCKTLFHVTKV